MSNVLIMADCVDRWMMVLSVLPMVQKNVFVHSDTLTRLTKKSFSLLLTEFQNKRIPKKKQTRSRQSTNSFQKQSPRGVL